tara:strand:- start:221 stop:568 length:348 start_codon:yes stop_codon:yes gene_type:complete
MPMTQITIKEWLSTTTPKTTTTGASMPTYSFQPLTKGHRTADHYLDTWIKTMQKDMSNTLYGRILRTGVNYIAMGFNAQCEWVEIPCHNLATAKLYIGQIMSPLTFELARIEVKS